MKVITPDNEYLFEQLKKIRIFQYLSSSEIKKLFEIIKIIEYQDGETIVKEGELGHYFYGLIKGSVNIVLNENQVTVGSLSEGDIFGEAAIFTNVKRTANIISKDVVLVVEIQRQDFFKFIKNLPQAGIKILMLMIYTLLKKLKEVNQELAFEKKTIINQDEVDDLIKSYLE